MIETNAKYFRLLDMQNGGRTMSTGFNSLSRIALKDIFLSYISIDFDTSNQEDAYSWEMLKSKTIEELCKIWEIEIQTSPKPFDS
jgi:hypothetical protein